MMIVVLASFLFASPARDAAAGAWIIERGRLETKLLFFLHSTDEEFILTPRIVGAQTFESGTRLPYSFGGESISRAYILAFRYGLLESLELGTSFSYYDLSFNDDGGDRRNTGPGDLFMHASYQVARDPFALLVRGGVKAPTGEFDIDPERVPLSENQWDLEGSAALGKSFYPLPVYVGVEGGYRYRFENARTRVKPGNEFFFSAEVGGSPIDFIAVKVLLEGLFAAERVSREFGIPVRNAEGRQLVSLSPYLTLKPSAGVFLEAGAKFLLAGKDYPAGIQFITALGWSTSFGR
jgi:hypothetical protein